MELANDVIEDSDSTGLWQSSRLANACTNHYSTRQLHQDRGKYSDREWHLGADFEFGLQRRGPGLYQYGSMLGNASAGLRSAKAKTQ